MWNLARPSQGTNELECIELSPNALRGGETREVVEEIDVDIGESVIVFALGRHCAELTTGRIRHAASPSEWLAPTQAAKPAN